MLLIDLIKEGKDIFIHLNNYIQISRFNDIKTVLFIPYLKSLTFEYLFTDAEETVTIIIEVFNEVIQYIRDIMTGIYEKNKSITTTTKDSLIYNDINKLWYLQEPSRIRKKLFINWETRMSHGNITHEEIKMLLTQRQNFLKKILIES